jgi:hypothetical protein
MVDAAMLVEFQTCRRRFLLSRKWRSLRWKAKLLFDSCLRQGILDLGNGNSVSETVSGATTRYMNTGANPGLDVSGQDPYKIALDMCAMLETILTTLGRRPLLHLKPLPSKMISDGLEWVFLAHVDDRGELHRVVTVDRFDDDRLSQEMHSWYVFGEICMARKPMHLHFIEIGQMRDGRRHSPWARAWQHEYIANRIKFQRKGNKALQGDAWKPIFLADSNSHTSSSWVDAMESEGVAETLIHDIDVTVPALDHIKTFVRDVKTEATQMQQWMQAVHNPQMVPMTRSACDVPFACAFQPVCYSPTIDVDVASLGMYKPRVG